MVKMQIFIKGFIKQRLCRSSLCSPAPSFTAYSRISTVNTWVSVMAYFMCHLGCGAQLFGQTPLWIPAVQVFFRCDKHL